MPWLACDGRRVAPLRVVDLPWELERGLLGQDRFDDALLLMPAFVVHTFGMRFAIDVAYCDGRLRVISAVTMAPNRPGRPRVRARSVLEAGAGQFARWGVGKGSRLAVEPD